MSVECPYCEKDQEIDHDDGYGYQEGEVYEQECGDCNKVFVYNTSISFDYDAEKAPCKNGGYHKWKEVTTCPKPDKTPYRCEYCWKEKEVRIYKNHFAEMKKKDERG